MEFIFDQVDTSSVTGKTYLPVFINEASKTTYGDNISKKTKSILKGNKNSGFSSNQFIIDFIDDLYSDYNIYDNYLKIFDKSFVSPLSKTGVDVRIIMFCLTRLLLKINGVITLYITPEERAN